MYIVYLEDKNGDKYFLTDTLNLTLSRRKEESIIFTEENMAHDHATQLENVVNKNKNNLIGRVDVVNIYTSIKFD